MFNQILTSAGLSKEGSDIYLSLLNSGPQSASGLAKTTSVGRTYVYRICQELEKMNLISIQKHGSSTTFSALSPSILLNSIESKKSQLEASLFALDNILPQLQTKFRLIDQKPTISQFEGVNGVKKVYLDVLNENKEILALVQVGQINPIIHKWLQDEYRQLRIERGIPVKVLLASSKQAKTFLSRDKESLRVSKTIDSTKFPFEHEINIYGNKVAIINNNINSDPLAIIIDNPLVATTFRSWFKLTWYNLK